MSELKPCPFGCGQYSQIEPVYHNEGMSFMGYQVACDCGAMGPLKRTGAEAEAAWNRREGA